MGEIVTRNGYAILVSDEDHAELSKYKWWANQPNETYSLYAQRWCGGKLVKMHRELLGAVPGQSVDHINGNGLDNRRENLRLCTTSQNQANRRTHRGRLFKGVRYYGGRHPFVVTVSKHKVGRFRTLDAAIEAYNAAAVERWGEFARVNVQRDNLRFRSVVLTSAGELAKEWGSRPAAEFWAKRTARIKAADRAEVRLVDDAGNQMTIWHWEAA